METTVTEIAQVLLLPEWAALRRIDLAPTIEAFVQVAMLLFVITVSTTVVLLVVSSCVGVLGGLACLRPGQAARGGGGEAPKRRPTVYGEPATWTQRGR